MNEESKQSIYYMRFKSIMRDILDIEGIYSNDPYDSGGKTKYGVTEGLARMHGYTGEMIDLTKDEALIIYKKEFWDMCKLDAISDISINVAYEIMDISVNCGSYKAGIILQRSLNALNNRGQHYPDIKVDSKIGRNTINALSGFMKKRNDDTVLLKVMNVLQGEHYISLAERRVKDERFIYGWFSNRIGIKVCPKN